MKGGLGIFIWKIAVGAYLLSIGVMGLDKRGDLAGILRGIFRGDAYNIFLMFAAVIALIAGVAVLLELFNVQISILDTLVLIIAIIWAVFIVLRIIGWIGGFGWEGLRDISVHTMVLASLLIASRKFG